MKREIVLIVLMLLPSVMADTNEDSILPNSYLWKFDLIWEKIVVFFTPSDEARAELHLTSAQERTSELQVLGIEVDKNIFTKVEVEWQKNILFAESLGADVSAEKKNHFDVLITLKEKVTSSISDDINKAVLPYVDLTN